MQTLDFSDSEANLSLNLPCNPIVILAENFSGFSHYQVQFDELENNSATSFNFENKTIKIF